METALWIVAVLLSGAGGFFLGRNISDILGKVKETQEVLKTKKDVPKPDERKSFLLDPEDVQQQALREHEERMKNLNP